MNKKRRITRNRRVIYLVVFPSIDMPFYLTALSEPSWVCLIEDRRIHIGWREPFSINAAENLTIKWINDLMIC